MKWRLNSLRSQRKEKELKMYVEMKIMEALIQRLLDRLDRKEEIALRNIGELALEYDQRNGDIKYLFELFSETCISSLEEHRSLGEKAMLRALELEPENSNIHLNLAMTYQRYCQFEIAIEYACNAVDLAEDDEVMVMNLAVLADLYSEVGCDNLSLQCLIERARLTDNYNVHLHVAQKQENDGRISDAIRIRESVRKKLDLIDLSSLDTKQKDLLSYTYVKNVLKLAGDYQIIGERLKARGVVTRLKVSPLFSELALEQIEEICSIQRLFDTYE